MASTAATPDSNRAERLARGRALFSAYRHTATPQLGGGNGGSVSTPGTAASAAAASGPPHTPTIGGTQSSFLASALRPAPLANEAAAAAGSADGARREFTDGLEVCAALAAEYCDAARHSAGGGGAGEEGGLASTLAAELVPLCLLRIKNTRGET